MKTFGFSRLEWAIVSVLLLGVGFLVLVPNHNFHIRRPAPLNQIGNNLRIIEGAKEQWALENKKMPGDKMSLTDLTAHFKDNGVPKPVARETYTVTTPGELAKATIKGELNGKRGPFTTTSF